MRQKKLINILIVLLASALLLILWFNGLSWVYAQLLRFGANILLIFSGDTSVSVKMVDDTPTFIVDTIVNGRKGSYPQKAELILLPFIMILTWQILLFFNLPVKQAVRSTIENIVIFFAVQLLYVVLLTGYHNSSVVKFIYDLLLDSFYIVALFLIVKDAFKYGLIGVTKRKEGEV